MIKNYFKTVIRNLFRNKVFSFINITGLSIGLCSCILILLYTKDEVSYDRFHKNIDRIYQLTCDRLSTTEADKRSAIAAMVQGPAFKQDIPEVDEFVRVDKQPFVVKNDKGTFNEAGTWVDENFFSVFSFPMIDGDPKNVLADPHSVVLTDETAKKYFGSGDPTGKTLDVEIDGRFEPFVVSGIAKKAPQNSSIKFTMLLPFKYLEATHPDNGWMWFSYPTYLVLHAKSDLKGVSAKMNQVFESRAKNELDENKLLGYNDKFVWGAFPFAQMHLNKNYDGMPEASDPIYSYILSCIAIFILLIACINFVNLTVAQSLRRSKEIGIRKVIGGLRSQLMIQFLGESLFVCFISFTLAIVLVELLLPVFNDLANKQLSLSYLFDLKLVGGFVGLFLITGLVAGVYPALVLSGFNPVESLYNRTRMNGENYLAKGLVVLQFAIANFLIIATLFVYAQFNFLTKTNLGYNDKDLLEVVIDKAIMDKPLNDVMKTEISRVPGVERVTSRNVGRFGGPTKAGGKEFRAVYEHVDEDYLTVLQVPLVAGRNFSRNFPSDSVNSVLVNETFVKAAGWKDGVGKTIDFMNFPYWGDRKITIAGVVKDYFFEPLKEKIQPQVFTLESSLPLGKFLIRINHNNTPRTLKALEKSYQAMIPFHPFQYYFKEELNIRSYEAESKWKQIITFGAMLTIFISCIGLFGLASLSIQQRTKEIGVRKVLGASVLTISRLLSKNFLFLVLIAFFIAMPAAWYAANRWLENFAYKIPISWVTFALAALLTLVVAMITVGYHTLRAALANPIRSLRNE
ncbi:ABC transporter permease [Flavitalea flava]